MTVQAALQGHMADHVRLDQDTVWLTQRQMAELFDATPQNVVTHFGNVFSDNELEEPATSKDFSIVQIG